MSDGQNFGFGKLVPGFDFLQNLAKGASEAMPQMPGFSNWIAPTLSVEEVDKRISELRAVQFWLEQNNRALAATVQALEVQKMTLVTLAGMNVTMSDLADALKVQPAADAGNAEARPSGDGAAAEAGSAAEAGDGAAASGAQGKRKAAGSGASATSSQAEGGVAPGVVDPLQWWTSLTQQFQQIAVNALQEAGQKRPGDIAADAFKTATAMTHAATDAMAQASKVAHKAAGSGTGTGASGGPRGKTAAKKAGAGRKSAGAKKSARSRGRASSTPDDAG